MLNAHSLKDSKIKRSDKVPKTIIHASKSDAITLWLFKIKQHGQSSWKKA